MRLLLVEDDSMIGEAARQGLRQEGHTVDWVRDGREADAAVAAAPYDAVLLDLGLPRRDGLSTIEAAAFLISRLENRLEIEKQMLSTFRRMLQRYRDAAAGAAGSSVARTPSEVAT